MVMLIDATDMTDEQKDEAERDAADSWDEPLDDLTPRQVRAHLAMNKRLHERYSEKIAQADWMRAQIPKLDAEISRLEALLMA